MKTDHIERPLDMLNSLRGKKIFIACRDRNQPNLEGFLITFDIHINLVIQTEGSEILRFVKGDNVLYVEEASNKIEEETY